MRLLPFVIGCPVRLRSIGRFVYPREGRIVEAVPTKKEGRQYFRVRWIGDCPDNPLAPRDGDLQVLELDQLESARHANAFTEEDWKVVKAAQPKKMGRPKGTGGRGGLYPRGPRERPEYGWWNKGRDGGQK